MSVRFFKILAAVVLAHLAVLSVIWVGFPVPFPRPPAVFTYQGALPAEDTASRPQEAWADAGPAQEIALDRFQTSELNHWVKIRDALK